MSNWTIKLRTSDIGGEDDVVIDVAWRCEASDGERRVGQRGRAFFGGPGEGFTPFATLTEADVIAWIDAYEGRDVAADVEAKLAAEPLPAFVEPPWAGS